MNKAAIGIVEKLHETHFIALYGDPHGSEQLVNPDGPEAAAIIMEMVEALGECRLIVANLPHGEERLLAKIDAALARGK